MSKLCDHILFSCKYKSPPHAPARLAPPKVLENWNVYRYRSIKAEIAMLETSIADDDWEVVDIPRPNVASHL